MSQCLQPLTYNSICGCRQSKQSCIRVAAAVTKHARLTPKTFNFKLLPKHADVLQQLLLSYVSLANNHVLDYEVQGLRETHKVAALLPYKSTVYIQHTVCSSGT